MGKSQPGVADRFFDADGTGTAFYAWKAWPVVRQANPRRQFFDSPRYAGRADTVFLWGFGDRPENESAREVARRDSAQIVFCEDGLLKSADTWANGSAPLRYRRGCSVMFDTRTPYYDGTRPSDLELALNDPSFALAPGERARARSLIDRIVGSRLTKYNHQPLACPPLGRPGRPKVLVVDQSYGDFSIRLGCADDSTFAEMLSDACSENPDADILVKTHPDTTAGERRGYYDALAETERIFRVTAPVNPYALMEQVAKVYVCSTQLGFEALLAGKEVHVYGMPFYAGWGLTVDRQACRRRTARRSLEELFHVVYLSYTKWVNPTTGRRCTMEEAIDRLLALRREYAVARKFFFIRAALKRVVGR
ncbi:MAG: hypothetical protein IKE55_10210 [Kiritimatiellae bacterium]|nr:hypothetical protein [Kiritimatiellia bacterium]